jgi:hypothetical protein
MATDLESGPSEASRTNAAVAFFIFRRPETTSRVFAEIRKARPKKLYVIADGAREGKPEEQELVRRTRDVVSEIDWPCQVTRVYAEQNMGLRQRIFTGLDHVFLKEDSAIVLEDDCLPSQSFFSFCSELLEVHEKNKNVALVSGFNFAPSNRLQADYFYSTSTYIWGWATWARTWKEFRASPQVESWTRQETEDIKSTFVSKIQMREFLGMMAIADTLNTWDISLAVWIRQAQRLTIIPRLNLVENIGFGAEATHTKFEAFDVQIPSSNYSAALIHPKEIAPDIKTERVMWRKKTSRWVTFPAKHPLRTIRSLVSYLKNR